MQSARTDSLAGPEWRIAEVHRARASETGPAYWLSMFAASALGTNLGDFWVDRLALDRWTSFASLVTIAGLAIVADRRFGRWTDAACWVAIVVLRAAATNVADLLTHDLKLGFAAVSVVLCFATVFAARFTRSNDAGGASPAIDWRYWVAMLLAGLFGTTAGDWATHGFGLYAAAGLLSLGVVAAIGLRSRLAPSSVMAYWCIVLVERCAGTSVGDALASERAVDLGLPLAIGCSGGLLLAGLLAMGVGRR